MVLIIRRKLATYAYSKGCGLFGALGIDNRFSDIKLFQFVHQLNPQVTGSPLQISAGWGHSAYTTDLGQLFIFGRPYDFYNLLRQNNLRRISVSITRYFMLYSHIFDKGIGLFQLPTHINEVDRVVSVKCSAGLTLVLNASGQVYTFGGNKWGQCAVPKDPKVAHYDPHIFDPSLVIFPTTAESGNKIPYSKITAIDTGLQHCIALTAKGRVYTWGKAKRGQLGCDVMTEDYSATPKLLEGLSNITAIASGFNHCVAINQQGVLFIWGKAMSEKRKTQDTVSSVVTYEDQWTPRQVILPGDRRAVEICCSNFSTVIRAHDNTLWAMGMGEYDRHTLCQPLPVLPALIEEEEQQQAQQVRRHKKTGVVSSFWSSTSTSSTSVSSLNGNNSNSDSSSSGDLKDGNSKPKQETLEIVQVPVGSRIMKGHTRVTLLVDIDDDDDDLSDKDNSSIEYRIKTDVYEVVVHNFEAYLKPVKIDIANECTTASRPSNNNSIHSTSTSAIDIVKPSYRVKDYSQGWLHALLVLKTISNK